MATDTSHMGSIRRHIEKASKLVDGEPTIEDLKAATRELGWASNMLRLELNSRQVRAGAGHV